jgi:hypothetical protein
MAVRIVLPVLALLLPSAATAQSFTIDASIFEGASTGWSSEGVGAPSVVYADQYSQFILYFESQTGVADAQCPDGYWSIGHAWSSDGLSWSVASAPLLEHSSGTYTGCGLRHPSVVRNGGTHMVLFSALQEADTCAGGAIPSWGCTRDSGIGYAMFSEQWAQGPQGPRLRLNPLVQIMSPVVEGAGYSEPSLLSANGSLHMYVEWLGEIQHARSQDLVTWTFDAAPVLTAGANTWSQDSLYSPAATCAPPNSNGATVNASGPMIDMLYGGRTWGATALAEAGWSNAESADSFNFRANPLGAAFTYTTLTEFISIDAMRAGSTTLVWFEEQAADGRPSIGFATDGSWSASSIEDRRCGN